jgi:hypothetical protein
MRSWVARLTRVIPPGYRVAEHFWLLCGIWVGVGNALWLWFRHAKYVESGLLSEADVRGLARGAALWVLVPSVVLWALQLSIGSNAGPHFIRWPDPQRWVALAMQVFIWSAMVYWVFARSGAEKLSAILGVGGQGPSFMRSPVAVKVGTILAIVSGLAAVFFADV